MNDFMEKNQQNGTLVTTHRILVLLVQGSDIETSSCETPLTLLPPLLSSGPTWTTASEGYVSVQRTPSSLFFTRTHAVPLFLHGTPLTIKDLFFFTQSDPSPHMVHRLDFGLLLRWTLSKKWDVPLTTRVQAPTFPLVKNEVWI